MDISLGFISGGRNIRLRSQPSDAISISIFYYLLSLYTKLYANGPSIYILPFSCTGKTDAVRSVKFMNPYGSVGVMLLLR